MPANLRSVQLKSRGKRKSLKARESAMRQRIVADVGFLLAGAIRETLRVGATLRPA